MQHLIKKQIQTIHRLKASIVGQCLAMESFLYEWTNSLKVMSREKKL